MKKLLFSLAILFCVSVAHGASDHNFETQHKAVVEALDLSGGSTGDVLTQQPGGGFAPATPGVASVTTEAVENAISTADEETDPTGGAFPIVISDIMYWISWDNLVVALGLGEMAFIDDAPSDSNDYVRNNGAWAVASGGGTDDQTAEEVPYDNTDSGLTAEDTQAAIDEVEARVDTNDGKVTFPGFSTNLLNDYNVSGGLNSSISILYSALEQVLLISLDGDNGSPGNSKYYGTDALGTKGFHDLPVEPPQRVSGPEESITGNFPVFTDETGENIGDSGYAPTDFATDDHNHSGVYEPADATILKEGDIGTSVLAPDGDGSGLSGIVDWSESQAPTVIHPDNYTDTDTTYTPSDANPQPHGTAAPGSSDDYARADHVHASDDTNTTYSASDFNHDDLGSITGTLGEYNHPTNAQMTVLGNTSNTNTGDETADGIATKINELDGKTVPVDADKIPMLDSAASYAMTWLAWENLVLNLETYFDVLYAPVLGEDDNYVTDAEKALLPYLGDPSEHTAEWQLTGESYSVTLSWLDRSSTEDGYIIERKTGTGGSFAYLDDVAENIETYTDTTGDLDQQYFYRVAGYTGLDPEDPDTQSGYSGTVSVVMSAPAIDAEDVAILSIPTADTTASGQIVADSPAGESLVFGDAVYLKSDGKWWKADATTLATAELVALATESKSADENIRVMLWGFARNDAWDWTITDGSKLIYLSETAGAMTQTAPSGEDVVLLPLGWATHADRMYFRPDTVRFEQNATP